MLEILNANGLKEFKLFALFFGADKMGLLKRTLATFIAACTFLLSSALQAFAASGGEIIEIESENQVVDSMTIDGKTICAYYHPISALTSEEVFSDETYSCAALVSRFYKEVYGIDMQYLYPSSAPTAHNAVFYETKIVHVGDIYMSNNHWAIVKEVSGSTVTLFEQNWCWSEDGKTFAKCGRTVDLDNLDESIGETFYTTRTPLKSVLKTIAAMLRDMLNRPTRSFSLENQDRGERINKS